MRCRHCYSEVSRDFLDLGVAPPSNAYLSPGALSDLERFYPLRIKVCEFCWLVQTEDLALASDLFNADYAYFSSTSRSWLEHAAAYSQAIIERLCLDSDSHVVEIACNDGYLLKNFVAAGIPCLGIEPTASTAAEAEKLGIKVLRNFFCNSLGEELKLNEQQADLIIGNNVYAHVPDINDFTRGLKTLLKPNGTITLEFPHLMRMLEFNQFDTIYHEHFSYLSLHTVSRIFRETGLRVYDVEELTTHGGSLRIFGCHDSDPRTTSDEVSSILAEESKRGMQTKGPYSTFQTTTDALKDNFLSFLLQQKGAGKLVVAYGAAAKGNTLLNYAGVKRDLLPFVFDAAPSKHGKFMPGSHIPILSPEELPKVGADYIMVLPWNLMDEIIQQVSPQVGLNVKYVRAIPKLEVI